VDCDLGTLWLLSRLTGIFFSPRAFEASLTDASRLREPAA
jgi:hypothetical protein